MSGPASARVGSSIYRRALVGAFILGIWLPLLDWRLGLDHTPELTENRSVAVAPTWPKSRAEWRALPSAIERYWSDVFGFRRRLIRWHALARYALGVSPSSSVIIGGHSWLFYTGDESVAQHAGQRTFTASELEKWATQLEARRSWLESRGAHFLFVISPDKQSVYSDEVPSRFGTVRKTSVDQLLDYLRAHSKVDVVDLRGSLLDARRDGEVYSHSDSHWNDHGAFVGYRVIVSRLHDWYPQLRPRARAEFNTRTTPRWNGDLALLLGGVFDVMAETSEQWLPVTPPAARELPLTGYVPPESGRYSVFSGENPALPRAVVFHDSFLLASDERVFAGQPIPALALPPPAATFRPRLLLAEQFSRSAFSWQLGFDSQLVESEKPDVVIEEHVERQLILGPRGSVPGVAP